MHPVRIETIDARKFLTESIAGPDFEQGHFELSLLSTDSKRYIWTRLFYGQLDRRNATGAMLALTVESHNLMVVNVDYQDGQVVFKSLSIGVAYDWENQEIAGQYWRWGTFYFLHADAGSPVWKIGGSAGPVRPKDRKSIEDFERIKAHGFYPWTVFQEPINTIVTAEAFLDQVTGFLRNSATFEPSISPNIQPQLFKY